MKRIIIIATAALAIAAIALTVGVLASGNTQSRRHCVKIGRLTFCYSSTIDQITQSVTAISALTNTAGGPAPADVSGVQRIVFNTPGTPSGTTTCINLGPDKGQFDCH